MNRIKRYLLPIILFAIGYELLGGKAYLGVAFMIVGTCVLYYFNDYKG